MVPSRAVELAKTLWSVFGIALAFLIMFDAKPGREKQIRAEVGSYEFVTDQRQELIKSAKSSCINAHKRNPFDRRVNITDQQITAYCNCYAVQIVMPVTAEEMGYVVRNREFSENFKHKIEGSGDRVQSLRASFEKRCWVKCRLGDTHRSNWSCSRALPGSAASGLLHRSNKF